MIGLKLRVMCPSTSEAGMNAEDGRELFIPSAFPLQKVMLGHYASGSYGASQGKQEIKTEP